MKTIPPAGTPVDQRTYNEACRKITELEVMLAAEREQCDELQEQIDECPYDRCPCR